jgi:ATP-binding cassette subfamily C protein CydC
MSDVLRLVGWLGSARGRTVIAILLGTGTVVTGVGLLGVATYLISAAALHPPLVALAGALALVRLFGLSRGFLRYTDRLVSHDVTFRMLAQLRAWVCGRLVALAPGQLLALRSADLLTRLVRDVDDAQPVFQQLVGPMVVALLVLVLIGLAFWTIDARVAALATGCLLALGVGLPALSFVATSRVHEDLVRRRAELDVRIADTLYGLPELLVFGHASSYLAATVCLDSAVERLQRRLATLAGVDVGVRDAVLRLGAWGVLWLGISLVAANGLAATWVAVLPIVLIGAAEAIEPVAQAAQRLASTRAAAARIWEIADRRPALIYPVESATRSACLSLEFDHVSFAYDGTPVLRDISFSLHRGQAIGIVGRSGTGKSTILRLAARAWDPTSGQVRCDGNDLRTFSNRALTSTIVLLTHDSYLFSASMRENLQVARPDATDRDMEKALDEVGLSELVAQLPRGLDTWLGEQGARLSGGERQRLGLARVLLHDAPILLLDEPTAHLDPIAEEAIMRVVRAASRTRGLLLVTHRLRDLDWLDELLVLEAGHIVASGRPAKARWQLMANL